jgi:hypothetical protein
MVSPSPSPNSRPPQDKPPMSYNVLWLAGMTPNTIGKGALLAGD